jgi:hypothetical protein
MNDDDERLKMKMYWRLIYAAPEFNRSSAIPGAVAVVRSLPGYRFFGYRDDVGMIDARSETLPPQCNTRVMLLRKLDVIFVVTLCTGRSAYAIRPRIDGFASMNKAQ